MTTGSDAAPPGRATRLRSGAAFLVWLLAVVAAAVLAGGALLVGLGLDPREDVVSAVTDAADRLNVLGQIVTFEGGGSAESRHDALVRTVLVNWCVAAVVYLAVGKVADRLIRP